MTRTDTERNLELTKTAIQFFLLGLVALTFARIGLAYLKQAISLDDFHLDATSLFIKLSVAILVGQAIYRLPDLGVRLSYTAMAGLLLVVQCFHLVASQVSLILRVSDALLIVLLVLAVYRLAAFYARAREAVEDDFLLELANGTSARIGHDFLASLTSSAARTLNVGHVCIAETHGAALRVIASAARVGAVPKGLSVGQTIDLRRQEICGQNVQALPLMNCRAELLGHICLLHDGGFELSQRQRSTLRVFSARAAAELERKQLDEANLTLESRMLQMQKLESLGVMAGGIAHDFNNLLAAVRANVAVLSCSPERRANSFVDGHDNLQGIESAVDRGAALCDQLLAYAGCAVRSNEVCDVNHLVRQINAVLKATYPDRVFELELEGGATQVWGDDAQLSQVLLNLMTNAVEASGRSPHGLTVRTTKTTSADGANKIGIEVSDLGDGISPEDVERIYDPFYTTKGQGRGLGLAAVVGIVGQHGGEIGVESQLSGGTKFSVTLPACDRRDVANGSLHDSTPESAGQLTGHVLLVDDDPLVRDGTRCLLEAYGMTVVTANDGAEAIEALQREGDVFHSLLLDQTMPGLSGIETYAALRELGSTGLGVLMSGYSEKTKVECPVGVTFLAKPFSAAQLLAAVTNREVRQADFSSTAK